MVDVGARDEVHPMFADVTPLMCLVGFELKKPISNCRLKPRTGHGVSAVRLVRTDAQLPIHLCVRVEPARSMTKPCLAGWVS